MGSRTPTHDETIVIAPRFNGPADSGNGGYVCGVLGARIDGPAEVTLRHPPPLGRELSLRRSDGAGQLWDGDTLVAEATPAAVDVAVPTTVSFEDAEAATSGYAGFAVHAFPTCFVCGPERAAGDGLRLFPGPVAGTPVAAAPWTPAPDLADADGSVRPEVVWAALDCPSYFGGVVGRLAVLGRLAVDRLEPVPAGQPLVVLGWGLGSDGRKHFAAAALTTAGGEVLGVSKATWIELRQP